MAQNLAHFKRIGPKMILKFHIGRAYLTFSSSMQGSYSDDEEVPKSRSRARLSEIELELTVSEYE